MISEREKWAFLMALEESPEDITEFKKWYDAWYEREPDVRNSEHSGDCTKQPWTCYRCEHENGMRRMKMAEEALGRFIFGAL